MKKMKKFKGIRNLFFKSPDLHGQINENTFLGKSAQIQNVKMPVRIPVPPRIS